VKQSGPKYTKWLVAAESGMALLVGLAVFILFQRLTLPRLGGEEYWFAAGWFILLALPSSLRFVSSLKQNPDISQTLEPEACGRGAFILSGLFVALVIASPYLGNYKLWLGLVYLAGITLRLAGMSLQMRILLLLEPHRRKAVGGFAAGIAFLACVLLLPWVRTDLVSAGQPPFLDILCALASSTCWGVISAAMLFLWMACGGSGRMAWLVFLAVGLGPGPTLAIAWIPLWVLAGLAAAMVLILFLRGFLARAKKKPIHDAGASPLTLYWLLRAMLMFWLGSGLVVALAAAWWYPNLEQMFAKSIWLRALALGGSLVLCVGVLAEYSLPLLGRGRFTSMGKKRKLMGVMLSATALLCAFLPVFFTPGYQKLAPPAEFFGRARRDLLPHSVVLDPSNPVVEMRVPSWLSGLTHVFVVSQTENSRAIAQGSVVAQLEAQDDLGLLYVEQLRAGVDTADGDLSRRGEILPAKHDMARLASNHLVYTPTGEAYPSHHYFTGIFLGREVRRLRLVRVRYTLKQSGENQARLRLFRVFVY
jgi:hypothetical protein